MKNMVAVFLLFSQISCSSQNTDIEIKNIKVSQESYGKLIALGDQFKSLKKEVNQLKKSYK